MAGVVHGASVAQETGVVVAGNGAISGVTRGASIADNIPGAAATSHILTEGADVLNTEGGGRLELESGP